MLRHKLFCCVSCSIKVVTLTSSMLLCYQPYCFWHIRSLFSNPLYFLIQSIAPASWQLHQADSLVLGLLLHWFGTFSSPGVWVVMVSRWMDRPSARKLSSKIASEASTGLRNVHPLQITAAILLQVAWQNGRICLFWYPSIYPQTSQMPLHGGREMD